MNILVLNGSPRKNGNTAAMVEAFKEGAESAGNAVTVMNVGRMKIAGCIACEYCHTKGNGVCAQKDDMVEVTAELKKAEMLVFAAPIYYFSLCGQIQCAIDRFYALGEMKNIKKTAMLLS
ncbi:MAG: flavodoxin family protein, partial [Methanomicrobium sp.]|nr:flavodoxin family protein [Methanomicrobium sp.]